MIVRRGQNAETPLTRETEFILSRTFTPETPRRLACIVWRQQCGTFRQLYGDGVIKVGMSGIADLGGFLCNGRTLQVETKTAEGRLSRVQLKFRDWVVEMGGLYVVARSAGHAQAAVLEALGYPAPGALLNG